MTNTVAVDRTTLASLVNAVLQLTAAVQTQLLDQATPQGPAASADVSVSQHQPPSQPSTSTGPHPDDVEASLASIPDTITGFHVVTRGRVPGVYTNALTANDHILGVSGGTQKKVGAKSAALSMYRDMWMSGMVQALQ